MRRKWSRAPDRRADPIRIQNPAARECGRVFFVLVETDDLSPPGTEHLKTQGPGLEERSVLPSVCRSLPALREVHAEAGEILLQTVGIIRDRTFHPGDGEEFPAGFGDALGSTADRHDMAELHQVEGIDLREGLLA